MRFVSLSQEDFIERSKRAHGDKYDYSITVFKAMRDKIEYICPKHGVITQAAYEHVRGHGCPFCAIERRKEKLSMSKEEFLQRAKEKFGDKYDYSKVDYVNYSTKVCIIHPKYGEFYQTPFNHLKSKSGYVIGRIKKETPKKKTKIEKIREKFIEATKGREYDYSEVVLTSLKDKITIICPKHGRFQQLARSHINGCGCPKCSVEKVHNIQRYTTENFIEKAKAIHGDSYDYTKVDYKNSETKVAIICHKKDALGNEHGVFWQKPYSHLNGHKCPKCNGRHKTTELWIAEAKLIFPDDRYSYEKTVYTESRAKLTVTCKEHGDFKTKAIDFLRGHGCPKCNEPKLEREVENALNKSGLYYHFQKKFNWLGGMSLDFYIPNCNVAIECQGEQHYLEKEFFNKREGLKERKERDSCKRQLCKENGIELIYFTEKKFEKFENSGNKVFVKINDLIEYIKGKN